jgi:hypothetical protein
LWIRSNTAGFASDTMSEEISRVNRLVKDAAGIIAGTEGRTKVMDAMRFAGFSDSERKNMKLYQQVRRRALKLQITEVPNKKNAVVVLASVTIDVQEQVSGLTSTSIWNDEDSVDTSSNGEGSGPAKPRRLSTSTTTTKSSEKTPKKSRRTSKQVQKSYAEALAITKRDCRAMKLATVLIDRSNKLRKNHPDKTTAVEIVNITNQRLNSNISVSTAARYVRQGMIGVSPMKRGPSGEFPDRIYAALKHAFVTYLKLEQAHGKKQSTMRQLSLLVNACVNKAGCEKTRDDLTRKLKRDTADQFDVGKANVVEARRINWTTSYNLDVWFDTWKRQLVDLGFGRYTVPGRDIGIEGEVLFYEGQTDRIGNIDETDGSLDDTTGQRGGRPSMTFFAHDVAGGGTAVNKSSYSATVICGSTAAGDPFPAHFQLMTKAQTVGGQRISLDWFANTKDVVGKFGYRQRRAFPVTFGMNEKAGMDAVELNKYMKKAILPLYPDIADVEGKRVIIKVDSGPGRLNVEMLAELRLLGLYLIPGVPNTTHKTQETDQNYGIYKSSFRENLRNLSQRRFEAGLTLKVADLALLVFGGKCPSTGIDLRDAFSAAFSIERNLWCWKKCGAVPLTRSLLYSGEIRSEVPVGAAAAAAAVAGAIEDPGVAQLRSLETFNRFYCDILTTFGCDGSQLRLNAPTRTTHVAVTEPHSLARAKAIKDAKSAGQMFYATGGMHLNSDEFFQARELSIRDARLKELTRKKKACNERRVTVAAAMALFEEKGDLGPQTESRFNVAEIKLLLKWKKLKKIPVGAKRAALLQTYHATPPPLNDPQAWGPAEERELVAMQSEQVDMKDTAIGVATNQMARAVQHNLVNLSPTTRAQLLGALQVVDAIDPDDGIDPSRVL